MELGAHVAIVISQMWKATNRKITWRAFSLLKRYVFSTEGHLLPPSPQISLVREHCSYYGAYCNTSGLRQDSYASDMSGRSSKVNGSRILGEWGPSRLQQPQTPQWRTSNSGLIKGFCRGLTHGQKFGITYIISMDAPKENEPENDKEGAPSENHPIALFSEVSLADSSHERKANVSSQLPSNVELKSDTLQCK